MERKAQTAKRKEKKAVEGRQRSKKMKTMICLNMDKRMRGSRDRKRSRRTKDLKKMN